MLFALLIIAFSATAYAADLKISGILRMDSDWYKNVGATGKDSPIFGTIGSDFLPSTGHASDRKNAYMAGRARLKMDIVADKNLSGTVYLEMDSSTWGDDSGSTKASTGQRNRMGAWTGDRAAVEVKNAYIDFGLPYMGIPLPMTMRIGLQGLSLRSGMFVSSDGMGINVGIKADPVTINPFWFKPYEGNAAAADDVDVYGLNINAKIDKIMFGGFAATYNLNTYPIPLGSASSLGSFTSNYSANFTWFGLYSDGTMGPIKYNFDLNFVDGTVENKADPTKKDVDYSGWATRIKVDYPWEKFNFGATFMYASGADQKKTDGTGLPGATTPWSTTATKVKSYVLPPGSETGGFEEGFIYYDNWALGIENYNTSTSGKIGGVDGVGNVSRGGIGGTWMAKIYGKYLVAPWWKVHLQAMYIGDNTDNGNTSGNAKTAAGKPRDDKSIGWEFGLLNDFYIYKGLTWYVGGGILMAGDALDYYDTVKLKNVSIDNPWQVATRLLYEF